MTPDEIKALRTTYTATAEMHGDKDVLALCDALEKSEADAAAMREAITPLVTFWDDSSAWLKERFEADVEADAMQERVRDALSSTAGQQLLEKFKQLEAACAAAELERIRLVGDFMDADQALRWVCQLLREKETITPEYEAELVCDRDNAIRSLEGCANYSSTAGQSLLDELARLRDENIRLSSNLGNAEVEVSDLCAWVGQAVAAMRTVELIYEISGKGSNSGEDERQIDADLPAIAACLAEAEKLSCL